MYLQENELLKTFGPENVWHKKKKSKRKDDRERIKGSGGQKEEVVEWRGERRRILGQKEERRQL